MIIEEHQPIFKSKQEYFEYLSSFEYEGNRITYNEDGSASVKL